MTRSLLLPVLLLLATLSVTGPALAFTVGDGTGCDVIVKALDTNDMDAVSAVSTYLSSTMDAIDATQTAQGQPAVLPTLTEQSLSALFGTATNYCRLHLDDTIRAAANSAYGEARASLKP